MITYLLNIFFYTGSNFYISHTLFIREKKFFFDKNCNNFSKIRFSRKCFKILYFSFAKVKLSKKPFMSGPKRQFIFRFNTALPIDSNETSSNSSSSTILAGSSSSSNCNSNQSLIYSSLLSPSQAMSNFNLNSPTENPSQAHLPFNLGPKAASITCCNSMNKSKTMDTISATTVSASTASVAGSPHNVVMLRRPNILQMVDEKPLTPSQTHHTPVSVQRPSSMGSNLLKRPSSILLGITCSSPGTVTGGSAASITPGSIYMSSSPKQQLLSKEVNFFNVFYS